MVGQKAKPVFSTVYTTVSSAVDASVFDVTALFLFMSFLISRIQSGKCTRNSKGWPYHLIFGPFVRFCVVCWHCVCLLPLFTCLTIVYALFLYYTCSPHYHTLPPSMYTQTNTPFHRRHMFTNLVSNHRKVCILLFQECTTYVAPLPFSYYLAVRPHRLSPPLEAFSAHEATHVVKEWRPTGTHESS